MTDSRVSCSVKGDRLEVQLATWSQPSKLKKKKSSVSGADKILEIG